MIAPKYTLSQIQALMAMAAAGWEAINLVTQTGVESATAVEQGNGVIPEDDFDEKTEVTIDG